MTSYIGFGIPFQFQYRCFKLHAAGLVQVISSWIDYSSCIPGIVVPLLTQA